MLGPPSTQPFTTCDADAEALSQLPHAPGLLPTDAGSEKLTAQAQRWFQGTGVSPSMQNGPVAYIYGKCAFTDIAGALATATAATHRIYLLGWGVDPDTKLIDGTPPVLLRDLLSKTKAEVRCMFWDRPGREKVDITDGNNGPIALFVNSLPNGAAILDSKLPFAMLFGQLTGIRLGVHHQKLLVVSGGSGLIAFVGGMDINNSRVDDGGGFVPLHDVHVRITGAGARNLLDVFCERWLDHPDSPALDQNKFGKSPNEMKVDFAAVRAREPVSPPISSTHGYNRPIRTDAAVAIGRTYVNLSKFTKPSESYAFAPYGEETAWRLVSNCVASARRFIYIEDQYFVSRRLKTALLAKLRDPQFRFLLILMEKSSSHEHSADLLNPDGTPANEFPYLIAARNEIRADFSMVDPGRRKWRMFCLTESPDAQRRQWCGSYVHSKTQIYDDDCAIIGSANADDRGYTFDTEVVACITEDPVGRMAQEHFARDLRIALWHKHLGMPHAKLADWSKGLQCWLNPPSSAMVVDCSQLEDSPLLGHEPILRDNAAANRLWSETIDPDADLLPLGH